MTPTLGNFKCKKCNILFEGEHKPQIRPRKSCPKCHRMVDIVKEPSETKGKGGHNFIPEDSTLSENKNTPSQPIIDDPDELLMSVAIRMLNKPDPDPRWANILISCKKENISIKGDDIESFRKLPNQILANLLNKSKQKT